MSVRILPDTFTPTFVVSFRRSITTNETKIPTSHDQFTQSSNLLKYLYHDKKLGEKNINPLDIRLGFLRLAGYPVDIWSDKPVILHCPTMTNYTLNKPVKFKQTKLIDCWPEHVGLQKRKSVQLSSSE